MKELFVDAKTSVYCILGNPVAHSMSPLMHNMVFRRECLNSVFTAFNVTDMASAVNGIRALGIKGCCVTIPHKKEVIDHLDLIDPIAEKIGAVNTILNIDGKLSGYNTDHTGAVKALLDKSSIEGKTVAVIGAGGASLALGYGIQNNGGKLTILNRTKEPGERLAKKLDVDFCPLADVETRSFDILINTTSVGMTPLTGQSPVPETCLHEGMVVMDIVYTPLATRLLMDAKNAGCLTVDGLSMFVYQGAAQFEIWTGRTAPVALMRACVSEALLQKN